MLDIRTEMAKLRGYNTASEYETELLMTKTPATVEKFLSDLTTELMPMAQDDLEGLTDMKRKHTGDDSAVFEPWDLAYYTGLMEAEVGVDEMTLRDYFPSEHVVAVTLEIYQELLGLEFHDSECSVWHEDVTCYKAYDAKSGKLLGQFYLDLFPRDGKFGHAACFPIL
jgi:Zn-dependent oligopeptidase